LIEPATDFKAGFLEIQGCEPEICGFFYSPNEHLNNLICILVLNTLYQVWNLSWNILLEKAKKSMEVIVLKHNYILNVLKYNYSYISQN